MNQLLDEILLKITKVVPEKWGGAAMIISFLIILNILDYIIQDVQTYGVVAAITLVVWMYAGMRLTSLYHRDDQER